MPAEDPVCARTGMLPKALHRPTAAAVAIATARDAGFIGRILLGVLATIIWDRYQSRRHGAKPLTKTLAKLWLEPLTVNLRADQLTASAFAKAKQGPRKPENAAAPGRGRCWPKSPSTPPVKVCDARARWTFVATFRTQRRAAIHGDGCGRGRGASRGAGAADHPYGSRPAGRRCTGAGHRRGT